MAKGLLALVEAVRAALDGKKLPELLQVSEGFREALADTLLDPETTSRDWLIAAYLGKVAELRSLIIDVLPYSGFSGAVAEHVADMVTGRVPVSADGRCVLVKVTAEISVGRRVYPSNSLICLEPLKAVYLAAAGLVSPVQLWEAPVSREQSL